MMALPFVLVLVAALTAMLGLRRVSVWVWLLALAATVYALHFHGAIPLNVAL